MEITVRNLRRLIRESWYLEKYENELMNDKSMKKNSVYVPDETKAAIRAWLTDMGLAGKSDTR
jgi:hypothetical protein